MRNLFTTHGDTVVIYAWDYKKQVNRACEIDAADLERVSGIPGTWYAVASKSPAKWYVVAKVWDRAAQKARSVFIHRLICGVADPEIEVHHRDNNGLNNRFSNLELCVHQQNIRYRYPTRDWKAEDRLRADAAEYRQERKIRRAIQEQFGLSRGYMHMLVTGRKPATEAYQAYEAAIRAAGIRTFRELQEVHAKPGRSFGVAISAGKHLMP